ncbi:MAG: MazG-like family protein [Firmicutes bacterium]|nr:MazG-like family protein [Bacillota bacterium]
MSRAGGARADIARNLQAIERLKADLAVSFAALYQAMYRNEDREMEAALADVVIGAFLLSKRLGISYAGLDAAVLRRLRAMRGQGHEAEEWFGDCSALLAYLQDGAG